MGIVISFILDFVYVSYENFFWVVLFERIGDCIDVFFFRKVGRLNGIIINSIGIIGGWGEG